MMAGMIEKDAKTKWCPKQANNGGDYLNLKKARCIASHCMMWQWKRTRFNDEDKPLGSCGLARE